MMNIIHVEYLDWEAGGRPARYESRDEGKASKATLYVFHEDGYCNPGLTLSLKRADGSTLEVFLGEAEAYSLAAALTRWAKDE